MEAEDELHLRRQVQAGAVLLEMIEDCSDPDAGVKRPGDAQLLDPCQFDVSQDEVTSTYLNCADEDLVGCYGCPAVLHPSHSGETVVLRKSFDVRFLVKARVAHEIEGPYVVRLFNGIREDHNGGASDGRPSEVDTKTSHDKRLVESL